ncbi:hypothetical protein D1872_332530 [compost metagenome]
MQRLCLRQRHIARQHNHHAVIGQGRHRLLHSMTGAQLLLLAYKFQIHPRLRAAALADGSLYL